MAEVKQCCRTCHWAKWQKTVSGKIKRYVAGICEFEVKWPPIPWAVRYPHADKIGIWPNDGFACPCWEPLKKV